MLKFIENLVYSTVRLEVNTSYGEFYGTGFLYGIKEVDDRAVMVIITNKHVLNDVIEMRFTLVEEREDGSPDDAKHVTFFINPLEDRRVFFHPEDDVDLCAIHVGDKVEEKMKQGITPFFRIILNRSFATDKEIYEYDSVEDIIMIGYPNGLWDQKHNKPIVRRGITATHPKYDFNGKAEFLIDAACFEGSSGSPIFSYIKRKVLDEETGLRVNRTSINFLGVLNSGNSQNISSNADPVYTPNHTGIVIKARRLREIYEVMKLKGF